MNTDNPDTMPTDEPTRWEVTQAEDVFLPSVRVQIGWRDVEAAVESGAIHPSAAHGLWAHWASPGSPLRVAAGVPGGSAVPTAAELALQDAAEGLQAMPAPPTRPPLDHGPAFSFTNTLYYFGGMLAIGAMTLFMTLGWELFGAWGVFALAVGYLTGALLVAGNLLQKGLRTPAGILATLAVCLVPLAVWAFQSGVGLWPDGANDSYRDYHRYIDWRWLTLELATLAAAVVLLYRYKLPFMVMPVAVTIWYLSMDVAHMLMQKQGFDWQFTRDVSLVFGLATCAVAVWVDLRTRRARQPVATVITVGAAPSGAPSATRVFAVGAVQPGITLGASATTGIHRQFLRRQGIDAQGQVTSGPGWFFVGTGSATRGDLAAMFQLRMPRLQLQPGAPRSDGDACFAAQVQLIHRDLADRGRDEQRAVVRDVQAFQLQYAGTAGQAHQRVGFNTHALGQGNGADQQGQQKNLTHHGAPE